MRKHLVQNLLPGMRCAFTLVGYRDRCIWSTRLIHISSHFKIEQQFRTHTLDEINIINYFKPSIRFGEFGVGQRKLLQSQAVIVKKKQLYDIFLVNN